MTPPWRYSDAMKRLSVRLTDQVHAALLSELPEWRKLRGPRFSLNNLCEEKLSAPVQPTQWIATTTGTVNYAYTTPAVTFQPTIQTEQENKKCQIQKDSIPRRVPEGAARIRSLRS